MFHDGAICYRPASAPGTIQFDLLIIDEASQLKPEESLGALARAEQAVIVGDTKQLPPTAFFERVAIDEDDDEEERGTADDAESIMEIAQKHLRDASLLQWHYRSRHEALIAWSNTEFYDNELIVFPSAHGADPRSVSVGLPLERHVQGRKERERGDGGRRRRR